jgi:hypothetical protein
LVVEESADLAAIDSATVGGEGDAGASTIAWRSRHQDGGPSVRRGLTGEAGHAKGVIYYVRIYLF